MSADGVAIVTGAAHGIGLATAQRLAATGLAVAALDVDGETLTRAPLPAGTLRLVRDLAEDPTECVADLESKLGTPTVLVNNVAAMDGRSFLGLPMDAVRRSLDVTLLGRRAVTQRFLSEDSAQFVHNQDVMVEFAGTTVECDTIFGSERTEKGRPCGRTR